MNTVPLNILTANLTKPINEEHIKELVSTNIQLDPDTILKASIEPIFDSEDSETPSSLLVIISSKTNYSVKIKKIELDKDMSVKAITNEN